MQELSVITKQAVRRNYTSISCVVSFLALAAFVYGAGEMAVAKNGLKRCPKCGETKKMSVFGNDKRRKDGLKVWCKKCESEWHHQYYQVNREKIKQGRKEYKREYRQKNRERNFKEGASIKEKRCTKCGEIKNADEFYSNLGNKDGLDYWCKDCKKQWRQENKETINARCHQYNQSRKEEATKYVVARYHSDIMFRLNMRMSSSIRNSLYGNKNGRHWETLVDYTIQDLKDHLESLFKPGMSWENYGEWHIDHKKPIKLFNFTSPNDEQFKQCWALSNLQPLWAEENLKKGSKY